MSGALCFANYIIVIYGRNDGNEDVSANCNEGAVNGECEVIYRARAAAYASLLLMLMVLAFGCKHTTRRWVNDNVKVTYSKEYLQRFQDESARQQATDLVSWAAVAQCLSGYLHSW